MHPTTLFKFSYNLVTEPGAFTAFRSFVFRFGPRPAAPHLTRDEAEAANDPRSYASMLKVDLLLIMLDAILEVPALSLEKIPQRLSTLTAVAYCIAHIDDGEIGNAAYPAAVLKKSLTYASGLAYDKKVKEIVDLFNFEFLHEYFKDTKSTDQALNIAFALVCMYVLLQLAISLLIFRICLAAKTINATTPLHRAAMANDVAAFRDLVQRGARLSARTWDNKSVRDLLPPQSVLIAEFNLNDPEVVQERDLQQLVELLEYAQVYTVAKIVSTYDTMAKTSEKLLPTLARVADLLDDYVYKQCLRKIAAKFDRSNSKSVYNTLLAAVKNDDCVQVKNIFAAHKQDVAVLAVAEQIKLLMFAPSIKLTAQLLHLGLDMRIYMFALQKIQEQGFYDRDVLLVQKVLCGLLPGFNEPKLTEYSMDAKYSTVLEQVQCSINQTFPALPIRIDKSTFDLQAIIRAWAMKRESPTTRVACQLDDMIFDYATYKYMLANLPQDIRHDHRSQIAHIHSTAAPGLSFTTYYLRLNYNSWNWATSIIIEEFVFSNLAEILMNNMHSARNVFTQPLIFVCKALMYCLYCMKIIKDINNNERLFKTSILFDAITVFVAMSYAASFLDALTLEVHKKDLTQNIKLDLNGLAKLQQLLSAILFMNGLHLLRYAQAVVHRNETHYVDLDTYEFKHVEPEDFLDPDARPMTFWKDVVEAKAKQQPVKQEQVAAEETESKTKKKRKHKRR